MGLVVFQKGFNYSQDGPGNRLVYHLQGCNLHCPWCANPEGMAPGGCLMQTGTPLQGTACPHGAVSRTVLDRAQCASCAEHPCTAVPGSGLVWAGKPVETEDLLAEIDRSAMLFFEQGGVTFTGGEATLQFDALAETLTALKQRNIHTALETNGTHTRLPKLFPLLDWLAIDLKHYDPTVHKQTLGLSNEPVLQNIRAAIQENKYPVIRIPLIGGYNAGTEDAQAFARLLSGMAQQGKFSVELLRYHEFGKEKWLRCGIPYVMKNAFVTDVQYTTFAHILKEQGLTLSHS